MRLKVLTGLAVLLALGGAVAAAQAAGIGVYGKSSLDQRLQGDGNSGFNFLKTVAGESYIVRDGSGDGAAFGTAQAGRESRRTPISYFGQLTDFQLADEESPARVEFLDSGGGLVASAWRPQEALAPFEIDQMMRQFNWFATRPPAAAGNGAKPKMDFVINTGDVSDNNQYNETLWNRQLMEGGTVNPNSGVNPAPYLGKHPLCPASLAPKLAGMDPARYHGVQDRDLWPAPTMGYFWDPDQPDPGPVAVNPYADAPSYPGLMNRAQQPFTAEGLKVPGYIAFGNHDALVQGNMAASKLFNQVVTGCLKPINDAKENSGRDGTELSGFMLNPNFNASDLLALNASDPDYFMPVPPDPERRFVSRAEYMGIFAGGQDRKNAHGFGFRDAAEVKASNGQAGYYSFSPRPGIRYIVLDTNAHGGGFPGSEGNIDDPQFKWFESKLKLAGENNELAIVFSHHAIGSLASPIPDENAPACTEVDPKEVPGCDADPRRSTPLHRADDARNLMLRYPNAIAWVAGHSHRNRVEAHQLPSGRNGFWSIQTAALAAWPKQNRLLQLFDNRDGTVSIFGTLLDHAAAVDPPASGTGAASMNPEQLASIGRTVGFNDSQGGGLGCGSNGCGQGDETDRNVELVIRDPRRPAPIIQSVKVAPKKRTLKAGRKLKLTVSVSNAATATAAARKVRVALRSSNRRVKVKKAVVIGRIAPGKTTRVKVVVRATRKARGKAKITVRTAGRKATANLKIKPLKKKKKRRR